VKPSKIISAAVLLLLPAVLLFCSADKLHYPTAQWDGWVLESVLAIRAGTFAADPYVIHPPLYLYLLAFFKPLLGADLLAGARLFNFSCYLLTGWLVFLLSRRMAGKEHGPAAGFTGAILFYLSPLAFQGTFLLDLGDTAVVPAACALYFYALAAGAGGPLKGLPLAAVFALNLWAKFIHSIFIVFAALAARFTGAEDEKGCSNLRIMAAGAALFLLSWTVYAFTSLNAPERWEPLQYLFGEMIYNYQRQDVAGGLKQLLYLRITAVARVLLWLWPLLALWALRLSRRGFGTGTERCMNYFVLIFMVGAWLSKGTSNGFPKYHAALLPPLCALCAAWLAGSLPEWRRAAGLRTAAAAALVLLAAYFAGDPAYTFSHSLKEALISGSGLHQALGRLAAQALAVPAFFFFLWKVCSGSLEKRSAAVLSLALTGLLWSSAMYVLQARGDYFTNYGYGTTGKREAVEYVRAHFAKGKAAGANEFAWEFKAAGIPFINVGDRCFIEAACSAALLRDPGTAFFVFGQASNTVEQVKGFLALTPEKLGRPFSSVKKGDFWIYDFTPR